MWQFIATFYAANCYQRKGERKDQEVDFVSEAFGLLEKISEDVLSSRWSMVIQPILQSGI